MAKTTLKLVGFTKGQFARKFKVDPKTVQEWIDQDRLDVIEYRNGEKFGRGGNEPLLVLITSDDRPERKVRTREE